MGTILALATTLIKALPTVVLSYAFSIIQALKKLPLMR